MYNFFKEKIFSKKIGLLLCCCHDVFDSEKILLWTSKVTKETKGFFVLFMFSMFYQLMTNGQIRWRFSNSFFIILLFLWRFIFSYYLCSVLIPHTYSLFMKHILLFVVLLSASMTVVAQETMPPHRQLLRSNRKILK